ncbi:hypothetical protein B0P06_005292 [Clostridium saccharoperbutylacetonicum]|uniref:Uncharacterized protein n=1 Tax=Clostridium saccharoperbutylacetonicum N1-4(HMT) TaxID=931276 RepID=M1MNY6_9CLOT|nr:hypothetical protein [Clostridium saccharoperbutylacetonicum]AGF56441.1 hypothetical protein Cspa_c26760 [Clostridium saccharoperbutylacetonicum N1-4(HMT)]NRT62813.1 hypothetical protein [Clostridium saccharoperbutylacetonicum]NSB26167.1 hypothetical protein [Clostridium saccharoperbutylacetonicum]NSB45521.1 hypothetical protein [Clostridium saccharoperbutylacetonicum]
MKTWTKTIFEKEYTSKTSKMDRQIITYIKIQVHFDFKEGLRYSVSVPNCSFCKRKLKDALIRALEHESIGMQKYNCLKEICTSKRLWNQI